MTHSRPIKIGVISKDEHAAALVTQLEKAGYQPVSLGGHATELPPTLDAVVCRTKSCSHGSFYLALNAAREKGLPVVMKNGVGSIIREINGLFDKTNGTDVHRDEEGEEMQEYDSVLEGEASSCRAKILKLIEAGGFYNPKLTDFTPTQLTEWTSEMSLISGSRARTLLHMSYQAVLGINERTQVKTYRDLHHRAAAFGLRINELFYVGKNNVSLNIPILSKKDLSREQLQVLATRAGWSLSRPTRNEAVTEDRTRIITPNYRAYWVQKDRRWRIFSDGSRTYMQGCSQRTREEVLIKLAELERDHGKLLPETGQTYEGEVDVLDVFKDLNEDVGNEEHEDDATEAKPVQPSLDVSSQGAADKQLPQPVLLEPRPAPMTPEQELEATLLKARELMNKLGHRVFTCDGFRGQVLSTHLLAPKGQGCNQVLEGEISTKHITKVTCEHCKATSFYAAAEFALVTLTLEE